MDEGGSIAQGGGGGRAIEPLRSRYLSPYFAARLARTTSRAI
jgi:hypothetical protein